MLKIIRTVLYGLASATGLAGVLVGGDPLVKYLWEMLHDSEYRYYYDTHYLYEPEIILLLSLILLIGVRICFALDKGMRPANPADAGPPGKAPVTPASANEISPAAAETPAPPVESADEKLTRLLNPKKD